MPLPDKHADEATVELAEDLWAQYLDYRHNEAGWRKLAEEARAAIIASMGTATAALVGGAKVATYRPSAGYAEKRLCEEYPDLTQHYLRTETRQVLDMDLFAKA